MKKILCLIDTVAMGGGAERQMIGLAGLLHKKGYDVTLATYYEHDAEDFIEKNYGMRSVLIRTGDSPLSKFLSIRKYVINNKYDTLIAYKGGTTILACMLKIFFRKIKLIVSERNTTQSLNRREKIKFFLYRWADVIVPNSETQGDFIRNHFPELAFKVKVITNFTDIIHFVPSKELKLNERLEILVTARIAEQKNVKGFMNVVKKLKDLKCNIHISWYGGVYTGQEEYAVQCINKYKELEIDDIMTFYPATFKILEAYQSCDMFCLPSFYEGFPNVVCEAMSCGKPILCSNVCDNPYIVQDEVNGFLFNPLDEEDMVKKINKMITLPQEDRDKMGIKSREIAEVLFSEETFVNKYIKLIEG